MVRTAPFLKDLGLFWSSKRWERESKEGRKEKKKERKSNWRITFDQNLAVEINAFYFSPSQIFLIPSN